MLILVAGAALAAGAVLTTVGVVLHALPLIAALIACAALMACTGDAMVALAAAVTPTPAQHAPYLHPSCEGGGNRVSDILWCHKSMKQCFQEFADTFWCK